MRLVFMGTPAFSCPSLSALVAAGHEVAGVYTRADRPKGRGLARVPSPIKELALHEGIAVHHPASFKDPGVVEELKRLEAELIVVVAYGKILPRAVLESVPRGCINVHASLLPRYRGAAPIARAVMAGEEVTGVTIMQLDEGMDTGPILLSREVLVHPEITAGGLSERLSQVGAEALIDALRLLEAGGIAPRPQDDAAATYAPPLKKEEGLVDWSRSARALHNLVRGLAPSPGAFTFLRGRRLKVLRTAPPVPRPPPSAPPGTVLEVSAGLGAAVAAGDGRISLVEVQFEGKRPIRGQELVNGRQIVPGDVLSGG
jgi:methionyl-tRNA formyltransferase